MSEVTRVGLCLLSMLLAWCIMATLGVGIFAFKLSNAWSYGVMTFVLIYALLVLLVLRTKAGGSLWLVPICTALAWPAEALAFFIGPQIGTTFINNPNGMPAVVIHLQFAAVGPLVSYSWLFGAIAGGVFLLMRYGFARLAPR